VLSDGAARPWSPYLAVEGRAVRAVSRGGVVPQGYISGQQAEAACRLAGKRLCALTEWLQACRGPMALTYPYGNTYERRRCNEARTPHPVVQFYGTSMGVFTYERMNNPGINMQPDSLARTGAFDRCVSPWGLFDLVGNLHEWIADPAGTFKGGFYVDAEINGHGCLYTTTAHAFTYHDYSTGFRCCANPR
jgi:formylglycine-generating enzyme required for sulfatase activity